MATSQNGWTVPKVPALSLRTLPWITGKVRKGDVWDVFNYLGAQFNSRVEKINPNHSWGYAPRPIRGSTTTLSNHASGTAVDFNAPKHPLGKSGTFSKTQEAEIRKILNELGSVVRWGGNYSGRKDEMHFEINAPANKVAAVARKIRAGTLRGIPVNGKMDPTTIRAWQEAAGTPVDGKISKPKSTLIEKVERTINLENARKKFLSGGPLKVDGKFDDRDRHALVKYLNRLNSKYHFLDKKLTKKDLKSSRRNRALQKALNLGVWGK